MTKHQSLAIIALSAVVSLLLAGEASSNLSDRLLASNFNLYSSPSPAGNMALQDLKGKHISLAGLRGKVVILNFWKIDCPPCSVEKPILERIHRKFADRGLHILAVNLFDDHEKLKSFVQGKGFSFTFAFDGAKRLSVRRQKVGTGPATTFVVNSRSEAIYEVPGVPTTYLIDRSGRVVGSSVGLINWEEEPFQELLESLLGPSNDTLAENQEFTQPAREGVRPKFVSAEDTLTDTSRKFAQHTPDTQVAPPALPFQGPSRGAVGSPSVSPQPPAHPERPIGAEPPTAAPQAAKKPTSPAQLKKKPAQQANKPVSVQPKTIKPAAPQTARTVQSGSVAPGIGRQSELPPLPAAIPYTPNVAGAQQAQPMVPDENGTVTARIPAGSGGQTYYPSQGASASLPPAQPVTGRNPIDGFILDSFKSSPGGQAQRPMPMQPPGADRPASSVIDQVGRDVKQLGSGIKDTFSRMLPGGR